MKELTKAIFLIITFLIVETGSAQKHSFISDSIRARELNATANALGRAGMHTQALDTFFASLQLRAKIYGDKSPQLAPVLMGIGISYRSLGQLDQALNYFKQAEENYLLRSSKKENPRVSIYLNIGNVYRNKLDYNNALQYFEQALQLYRQEETVLAEVVAGINYNIAEIYYLTNRYDKALQLVQQNINSAYAEDQILYFELLAFIHQMQGNMERAKKNYLKALDLTTKINSKNEINVAIAYLNYSTFLIVNEQFDQAKTMLEKVESILHITKPLNYFVLSDYYKTRGYLCTNQPVETQNISAFKAEKKKNLYEAINWTRKGLEALKFPADFSLDALTESAQCLSKMDCINLLKIIGDNYVELSELEQTGNEVIFTESLSKAIETYQVVAALIQRARKEITKDESKIQLTALEYSTFYKIVETSYTAYFLTRDKKYLQLAFQNAEHIKGSSVFDEILNRMAISNSLIPDSLLTLERTLNNRIAEYTAKIHEISYSENPDSSKLLEYNDRAFEATRQREELNHYMEREYSDYYNLKYSRSMFSLQEIQQKLKDNQVLLEFVVNETENSFGIYTFLISNQHLSYNKQVFDPGVLNEIESMYYFVSNPDFLSTTHQESVEFCTVAHALYQKLIAPYEEFIQNKHLIIVPDGKLNYIPFEGLLQQLPDTTQNIQFNSLDYLIQNFSISYTNSANLLFRNKNTWFKSRKKALAFAPEYKGEHLEIEGKNLQLVPLPGVQEEVRLISEIVNTRVYKGAEATEANFRSKVENYDLLHLAMHAFINDSIPAYSNLAFTQVDTDDSNKEGLLNTLDIYNLKLKAKLAVLSACNTGMGQLRKGEGVMSFARAFLYAGCPSIVMSLWEVDDQSGTEIMAAFYKNLKKGKSKDEALRMAKLDYLASVNSRKAHPHYWLSFMSIGDSSPLYISYDFYFFLFLIIALLGIGIDQLIRNRRGKTKMSGKPVEKHR